MGHHSIVGKDMCCMVIVSYIYIYLPGAEKLIVFDNGQGTNQTTGSFHAFTILHPLLHDISNHTRMYVF